MKIVFFDSKSYDRQFFARYLPENYKVVYVEDRLSAATVALSQGADVVCLFVNDKVDAEIIDSLVRNKVKLIAMRCAGFNNLDLPSLKGKIPVVRVPDYSPHGVAEHALALMMSLNRKIHKAYQRVREGNFSLKGLIGFDFYGKTAAVIGTGKIGQALLEILAGLGMKLLAYDLYPRQQLTEKIPFRYSSLEEIWRSSDVISLHCPLSEKTHHLINRQSIAQMRDRVMLINTGRGALINTDDLIDGLKSGKIGSAGLDVYEEEEEYFFEDHSDANLDDERLIRLLSFQNVLVTSHQAFLTEEALHKIAQTTVSNIVNFFNNGQLTNSVEE